MIRICFFVPVCPKDGDRILWTIASIRRHCQDYRIFVLADGDPDQFPQLHDLRGDIETIYGSRPSKGHWGRIWQMQVEAMLRALNREDISENCVFIKIDADALIVRPGLFERASQIFLANPQAGQIGQCHSNISGRPLANDGWANFFVKTQGVRGFIKLARNVLEAGAPFYNGVRCWIKYRQLIRVAVKNGYELGEFAIGGAYAVRPDAIRKIHVGGWLVVSPFEYLPRVGEDVVMTLHVYAVGYTAVDDVAQDGIFAVCGEEPWIHPFELKERGHYIIHPTKYGVTRLSPLSQRQSSFNGSRCEALASFLLPTMAAASLVFP